MKTNKTPFLTAPPIITISGRDSVKIENISGVKGFNSDSISINIQGGVIIIEGDSLEIGYMEEGLVLVHGKIRSVSFA